MGSNGPREDKNFVFRDTEGQGPFDFVDQGDFMCEHVCVYMSIDNVLFRVRLDSRPGVSRYHIYPFTER